VRNASVVSGDAPRHVAVMVRRGQTRVRQEFDREVAPRRHAEQRHGEVGHGHRHGPPDGEPDHSSALPAGGVPGARGSPPAYTGAGAGAAAASRGGLRGRQPQQPADGCHARLEEIVGDGDDDQGQRRRARQAADQRERQRRLELAAAPEPERQRDQPQDRRERGHEDRPQTGPACLEDRLPHRDPALAQLADEVHQDDRVVVHDPDQHHQPDQAHGVEAAAGEVQGHGGADHRQRHAEQDRERMEERLELRREDHVHEEDRQHERERELAEAAPHLLVLSTDLGPHAGRRVELRDGQPRRCNGLRQPAAGHIRVDRNRARLVEATDLRGSQRLPRRDQLAQRDALHAEQVQRLDGTPHCVRQTDDDGDLPVEIHEFGRPDALHVRLDRTGDLLGLDPVARGAIPVDVKPDFGLPQLGAEPNVRELRHARQPRLYGVRERQRRVQVLAPDANRDVRFAAAQQLAERRGLPRLDGHRAGREAVQQRPDALDHRRGRLSSTEPDIDACRVRTGLFLRQPRQQGLTTDAGEHGAHVRIGQERGFDPAGGFGRHLDGRAPRQGELDRELSLVHVRQHCPLQPPTQDERPRQHGEGYGDDPALPIQRPLQHQGIPCREAREAPVEGRQRRAEDAADPAAQGTERRQQQPSERSRLRSAPLADARGEQRDQHQRHHGARREAERDGDRERAEQLPGHALDVDDRAEHRDRGQRRPDDRALHLLRARRGRFGGRDLSLPRLPDAEDVLQHHDRVVHQHPDAQREPAQRHDVERHAHRIQQRERGDDGDRDRERDHDRVTRVAQEEEQDQEGQDAAGDE